MSCEHQLYDNTRSQYTAEITKRKRETQNISKLKRQWSRILLTPLLCLTKHSHIAAPNCAVIDRKEENLTVEFYICRINL